MSPVNRSDSEQTVSTDAVDQTRRKFLLGATALSASALLPACSKEERKVESKSPSNAALSGPTAGEGPEVTDLRFGMIALTDCSPSWSRTSGGSSRSTGSTARW